MNFLQDNLFIDKELLKEEVDFKMKILKAKPASSIKTNYYVMSYPLHYELLFAEDRVETAHIYNKTIESNKPEKLYILQSNERLQDNYEIRLLNDEALEYSIYCKEVHVVMKRKMNSFFEQNLEENIIYGKMQSNFYFYINLIKEESVTRNIAEIVVCEKEDNLLAYIGEKFKVKNDINDIKMHLFKNHLEQKISIKEAIKKAKIKL